MVSLLSIKKEIAPDLKKVNQLIEDALLETTNETLSKIYSHLLKSNGKQIRASLVIFISKFNQNANMDNVHKLAAGIELIHLASLIHDDIIDNANERRNQPTIHTKFNVNNGIISGVHCYAVALKLITSIGNLDVLTVISNAVIDLCEGESFQVNNRHNFSLSNTEYWDITNKKTASLFKASCITAGILSNQSKTTLKNLSKLGSSIGNIFQLVDDYLDIFDTKNELSKKIMQDLTTGDISLPILLASKQSQSKSIEEIKNSLLNDRSDIVFQIKKEIKIKNVEANNFIDKLPDSTYLNKLKAIILLITNRALDSV